MFLENQIIIENKIIDERISRAIDNDHTAAMKAPVDKRRKKKNGSYSSSGMITVCMLCQKAFKNPLVYRKHLRLHGDKNHQCPICGETFMKKHYLQTHLQSSKHSYQCPYCHKRFSQKTTLNQHLKFHATKKTYKCNICDKDFFQQEHLKTHLRHHNNERPFECELCHKSFNIKSSLQRHMNCHTGEKPFICDICNRGYTRRSVLMLHIQQVHENKKPFQCDECHLCFSQKGNLQAHFKRKHMQSKGDGKRGSKDGKMKKVMKRRNKKSASKQSYSHMSLEDSPNIKLKMEDNASLHTYASKVKAIIKRGQVATENQRIMAQFPKSAIKYEINEETGESPSHSPESLDSSSSCSLSDEAVDVGCTSSSGEDIPEVTFSAILDTPSQPSYFESLLGEDKAFEDFLLSDTDHILGSLPQYEFETFASPIKTSAKGNTFGSEENASWIDDCAANPLFTAEDLDDIKDISNMCGISYNALESGELSKQVRNGHSSRIINHWNISMLRENLAGSPTQK